MKTLLFILLSDTIVVEVGGKTQTNTFLLIAGAIIFFFILVIIFQRFKKLWQK